MVRRRRSSYFPTFRGGVTYAIQCSFLSLSRPLLMTSRIKLSFAFVFNWRSIRYYFDQFSGTFEGEAECTSMENNRKCISRARASGSRGRKRAAQRIVEAEKSSKIMRNFFTPIPSIPTTTTPTDAESAGPSDSDQDRTINQGDDDDDGFSHDDDDASGNESSIDRYSDDAENRSEPNYESETDDEESRDSDGETDNDNVHVVKDIANLFVWPKEGHAELSRGNSLQAVVKETSKPYQHDDGPFPSSDHRRRMNSTWFQKIIGKSKFHRTWLVYSVSKSALYCFCCLLYPESNFNCLSAFEKNVGFTTWKNRCRLDAHERSSAHRRSFCRWKEHERSLVEGEGQIDDQLADALRKEEDKWRQVLKRLLNIVIYLARTNAALRGHVEKLTSGDEINSGNFLELVKLLSKYDPVMKSHLEYAMENPHAPNYLSPRIQNEFIELLGSSVRDNLLEDIKTSRYYGLLFDSTPDIAHREQMSQVVRYVHIDYEKKTVEIRESFLGFISIKGKDAASLQKTIIYLLDDDGVDIMNCRSQCYDNAAVMAGHHTGLQSRILSINEKALFVNCDNHSTNLAGVHAASQDPEMATFFAVIGNIFKFFSRSTQRWARMKSALKISLKRESDTRWSARKDAVNAVHAGIDDLETVIADMSVNRDFSAETRGDASVLVASISDFKFLCILNYWSEILPIIDRVQKRLQDPNMNFHEAATDLRSLETGINTRRETICTNALNYATTKCTEWNIPTEKRVRRKRRMPGEEAHDAGLSVSEEMDRIMKNAIDRLVRELHERSTRLFSMDDRFGFLLDPLAIIDANVDTVRDRVNHFATYYQDDVNQIELVNEILDTKMLLQNRVVKPKTPIELLRFIISYGEDAFPNLRIAIVMMLTVATSIASCERSFSKLKLILNYLRNTMSQCRLTWLALLSIESAALNSLNIDEIINRFSALKARKYL